MSTVKIVAIGGGGCTNGEDPLLETVLLEWLDRPAPRVGFLGSASRNDPGKILRFSERFSELGSTVVPPLALDTSADATEAWLAGLDLVYVGGGNTAELLAQWRKAGLDRILVAAARRGVMFAGVSAGAVCWFEAAFSDAFGHGYTRLPGLGVIPGSCCPHFSSEPARQPAYREAIAARRIEAGLAIDDGVAVLCNESGPQGYFSARTGHAAYRVADQPVADQPVVEPLGALARKR